MLPVYISYFTASGTINASENKKTAPRASGLINALVFVAGFTLVFCLMGAFAGSIGMFLNNYATAFNIVTGTIVIFFGIQYLDILPFNIFRMGGVKNNGKTSKLPGLLSTFIFGIIFSLGWTPCVGAFLGSALMMASQSGSVTQGILMLFVYSLGLGIPFTIAAILLDKLTSAFNFIKKHYKTINLICGIFLIIIGILMISGLFGRFLSTLSF